MKEQLCNLLAVDSNGGQAIFRQGKKWFRVAADDGWKPSELQDRRSALRCTLLALYEARDETHASVDALVVAVEAAWDESLDVEDVPLAEVVHLFPESVRRGWQTQQDEHRREQERLSEQSKRLRKEIEAELRPPQQSVPPSRRWRPRPPSPWPPWPPPSPWPELEAPFWDWVLSVAHQEARRFGRPQDADIDDLASVASIEVARWWMSTGPEERRPKSESGLRAIIASFVKRKFVDGRRHASAKRRAGGRVLVEEPRLEELVDPKSLPPADTVHQYELRDAIETAIGALQPRDAELARLFLENFAVSTPWTSPTAAIAEQLGVTRSAVRQRWARVRALLAHELKGLGVTPSKRE